MRGQWNQEECFPQRSKVVTLGAMQCIHLDIGHSGLELGRKWGVMMDAIQQIGFCIGHSVVELGRKMKDRLYFLTSDPSSRARDILAPKHPKFSSGLYRRFLYFNSSACFNGPFTNMIKFSYPHFIFMRLQILIVHLNLSAFT